MGASYYQFCPVAKAMELLDERWTLLVIREMLAGSQRFNELRRGLPRMSPTLLSKRLHLLVAAGLVIKTRDGTDVRYLLTPAGAELRPIVEGLAGWGVRWIGELGEQDLDPKLLLWDMHRYVVHSRVPPGRTVIEFAFADMSPRKRRWWMVITERDADVCDQDPGFEVAVRVQTTLRTMVEIWRGDQEWREAARRRALTADGSAPLVREMPDWFDRPDYATVVRASGTAQPVEVATIR